MLQARRHVLSLYSEAQPEVIRRFKEFPRHNRSLERPQQVMQRLARSLIFEARENDHRALRRDAFEQVSVIAEEGINQLFVRFNQRAWRIAERQRRLRGNIQQVGAGCAGQD